MAEKQLTVAELMARVQKENPDIQPRRRRRRSLEEGGISVAELTGSLPAVDARPAEPKHSSIPIDAENPQRSAPQPPKAPEPAKPAEQIKPAEPKVEPEKPKVKVVKVEPPETTEAVKLNEPSTSTKPVAETEAAKPEVVEKTPEASAAPSSVPVRKVEVAGKEPATDEDETSVIPVVRAMPAQAALTGQPKPEVKEAVVAKRDHVDELEADFDEFPDKNVHDEHDFEDFGGTDLEADASINPVMLVLMVFGGLLIGVLVFLGFQALWENFNAILVSVLAVVVTAGVVAAVRRMKTGRDGFTLVLAALAGLAMTFGPSLVTVF